jgi:hypothetical protein
MGPVTYYHVVEDRLGPEFPVPVWLERVYQMRCVDHSGQAVTVPVRAYDPELVKRRIDQKGRDDLRDYFAREFARAGLKTDGRVGQADAWWIPGGPFALHLVQLAGEGITIYATADELAARPIDGPR